METLTVVVEAVAKTGKSFKGNDVWYKRGKGAKFNDFFSLQKGTEVILTKQGEWVSDFTTVGGSNGHSNGADTPRTNTNVNNKSNNDTRNEVMNRQSAVKSVLGSPAIAQMLKSLELQPRQVTDVLDTLVLHYLEYITTGEFGSKTGEIAELAETTNV